MIIAQLKEKLSATDQEGLQQDQQQQHKNYIFIEETELEWEFEAIIDLSRQKITRMALTEISEDGIALLSIKVVAKQQKKE